VRRIEHHEIGKGLCLCVSHGGQVLRNLRLELVQQGRQLVALRQPGRIRGHRDDLRAERRQRGQHDIHRWLDVRVSEVACEVLFIHPQPLSLQGAALENRREILERRTEDTEQDGSVRHGARERPGRVLPM
jgi:hypothetical protein